MYENRRIEQDVATCVICMQPAELRQALGIIGARLRKARAVPGAPLDPKEETDRILWLISELGVLEVDGPIGMNDPTYRGPHA